jgi:hypothetical protein
MKTVFAFPVPVKGVVAAALEFFSEEEKEPDESLLEALTSVGAQLGRVSDDSDFQADLCRPS